MSKKVKWGKLPKEEQEKYINKALSFNHPMFKNILDAAKMPKPLIDINTLAEKHKVEIESNLLNIKKMFEERGRELYNDNRVIEKWFKVDDPEQYIEDVSHLVNDKKGKELYTVVLAMQHNKQLKSIGYNELSELFRVLFEAFDIPDSLRSLSEAHKDYQAKGNRYIKDETIEEIQAKLPR